MSKLVAQKQEQQRQRGALSDGLEPLEPNKFAVSFCFTRTERDLALPTQGPVMQVILESDCNFFEVVLIP